ncbi:acetyl-CoA C-acetyltransferase [Nakamurella flavida]|uniref:thiolase family protein n=1 Tax=Nakamurella flavida TaxID=363630 RepID=UPI0027833B37|nr:thiolase family protein [Nakamurella flavida]MDP9779680.1 acetyl-CoA C-acetyltransferase [Nakamurella flavida]
MIVQARRTPVGSAGHALADLDVIALAAPLLADAAPIADRLDRRVDDVVLGNCLGPGGDIARVAALAAGLGADVPGVTVDRQCGSGLDAVLQAASRIRSGDAELILAGGVESASTAPWRSWPPRDGRPAQRYSRAPFAPAGFPDPDMGTAADDLARRRGLGRDRQDAWAERSHARAIAARTAGRFAAELLPIGGLDHDERPRPGLDAARLARLRPAFGPDGTATAGNSCGISDGAALLTVTTRAAAGRAGLPGPRIVAAAVAAGDPALPGAAPVPAVRALFDRPSVRAAGVRLSDVSAVEITEAFASVVLAVVDELHLDPETVCTDGGAIAMGHPWGASGAVLLVRLAARMRTDGHRWGLAACAIGGGQGIAMLLEQDDHG